MPSLPASASGVAYTPELYRLSSVRGKEGQRGGRWRAPSRILVLVLLVGACASSTESADPAAAPSASSSIVDPYKTPVVVAPTHTGRGWRSRGFCEIARDWAIEIGIFRASAQDSLATGGEWGETTFKAYARSAQGLRDAAPDDKEGPYTDLMEERYGMLDAFKEHAFKWKRIPPRVRLLLQDEADTTAVIFADLNRKCGVSQRHVKKGFDIIEQARREAAGASED